MTAVSGHQYSVGFRQARAYALNANGLIYQAVHDEAAPYEGIQIPSVKALELTIPDIRRIVHIGDDSIRAEDTLPRIEPTTGSLRVGRNDHDLYALITGTKARTVGEASTIGYATDQQGSEIDLAILGFQQSLDAAAKTRRYRAYMFPIIRAIPVPGTMDENPAEFTFNLTPQISSKAIWGQAFTVALDGFTEAEFQEGMYTDFPHIVAWQGDNTATKFSFHADRQAASTAKIHGVWVGASGATSLTVDATVTKATDGVTPTTKPASGDIVVCMYEYVP
jgi:hypothetical protein